MIPSPCINLCKMDDNSGLCRGCYRTIDEIAAWARLDEARQRKVLAAVAERRAALVAAADEATKTEN